MNASASKFKTFKAVMALAVTASLGAVSLITPSKAAVSQPGYELITHVPVATLPTGASIKIASVTNPSAVIASSRLVALDGYGWWGITTVPAGAGSLCFQATGITASSTCIDPAISREVWLDANGVPALTRVAAAKNIKVHLATTNKTSRFAVLTINGVSTSQPFVKVGTTDIVATFSVPANTTKYLIKTQYTKSKKLFDDVTAIEGDASKLSDIYLTNGLERIFASSAARSNLVLIHYNRPDKNYKGWGIHTWSSKQFGGAATETTWAKPKMPTSSTPTAWGVTFSVPLVSFSTKLPYIIHKLDLKDPSSVDQYVDLATMGNEIWVESGKTDVDGNMLVSRPQQPGQPISSDGPTLAEAQVLAGESARSSLAADSIYFVMTDRYKNGATANDKGGVNSNSVSATGYNPADYSWSHGGDLAGLSDGCERNDGTGEGLPRIKNLGFGAVWITPPFKQNFVQGGSASYHGYWINDFTTIDPHWGTNAEFKSFVDCAHRLGMKVMVDIVMNHTGDVISYRDGSYNFRNLPNTTAQIPSWGTNLKSPAWLNDLSNYHNQGNVQDWGNKSHYQFGDFFGLDDIKTENDVVVQGFADVYAKWVNEFGVDGFRIDTAKHVDDKYFSKWWPKMVEQTATSMTLKNQKLFAYGEYYDSSTVTLASYMRKYGLPSVLDFAFQSKALSFAAGGTSSTLSEVFNNNNNFITKNNSPYDLVTFLGNHDMGRAAFLLNQFGTTRAGSLLLAHDLMFLTRGIPSVYYGDEVGMIGTGGDKASRQDMFPTQVSQWRDEERVWGNSIGNGSSLTAITPLTTRITKLNALRKQYPALATGSETVRVVEGNVLAISRFDKTDRREYVVAFNSGSSAKAIKIPTATPSSSWQSLLTTSTLTSSATGELSVSVPARGTVIFRANNQLPLADDNVSITLSTQINAGSQSVVLSSGVSNQDLGTVTFVMKNGAGPWISIGSDDSRSFGMTWDYQPLVGAGLPAGSKISFAAIYKSSSGAISASGVKQVIIP
ncbi:MAG: alpha-amylase family glycosyl hydrolase [Rhodoluna sp.]|nr:alpha-amylase family glycosyl hydrolase [Rhodoluna sp.]